MKERSLQEKLVLMNVFEECDELPYPLVTHVSNEFGDESFYDIPLYDKEKVIKDLYLFEDMPGMDEELKDIHCGKTTTLRKCMVLRWGNRNILVSEFYFEAGGTIIDLIRE